MLFDIYNLKKRLTKFYSKKLAGKIKDPFNLQLYETRYTNSKIKYTLAKEELEKTLNHAKYIKVWEPLL